MFTKTLFSSRPVESFTKVEERLEKRINDNSVFNRFPYLRRENLTYFDEKNRKSKKTYKFTL